MDLMQHELILEIINQDTAIQMIDIVNANKAILSGICFVLFEEECSNFKGKGFEEKSFGKYHLCSLGDYGKAWIIDSSNLNSTCLKVYKKVYFDLNIVERIFSLKSGKKIEDKQDLVDLLNYINENGFDLGIENYIAERFSKTYDSSLVQNALKTFFDYATGNDIDVSSTTDLGSCDAESRFINECIKASKICDNEVLNRQLDSIICLITKAVIIKSDHSCLNKIDELVKFSINDLKAFLGNEIYLLRLYLENDAQVTQKVFAKLHTSIKEGIENAISNTAWDIYHARLVEQSMKLYDSEKQTVVLPFFATNDRGVKDYWDINPRKMIVLDGDKSIPVYSHNIGEIEKKIRDKALLDQIHNPNEKMKREMEAKKVDFKRIKKELFSELQTITI